LSLRIAHCDLIMPLKELPELYAQNP
jgi:hypothetical protein